MNDGASNLPANTPDQPSPAAANAKRIANDAAANPVSAPSKGSPLKLLVPIGMLMAVVFGVTFFAQYTPKKPEDDTKGDTRKTAKTDPLRFGSSARKWDPRLGDLQDFHGFYEVGTHNNASFWFENRNPAAVNVKLMQIYCESGRLAAIPPDVTDQLILSSIISGFPQGLVSALPMAVAGPAPNIASNRLNWQEFNYRSNPHAEYKVPRAPDSRQLFSYQWGILEIQFEITAVGTKPFGASYALQVEGTDATEMASVMVAADGVDPFELSTKLIGIGEWKDSTDPRTYDFFVYSSSRGPKGNGPANRGDLIPPKFEIEVPGGGRTGPFVTVGPPQRVPESELYKVFEEVSQSQKKPVRIDSAYRYTVTVKPVVGEELADIGPLERDILFELPGMSGRKAVRIKGMVRGAAWLNNDRTDIDLPSYRDTEGIEQTIRIITEHRNAEIELVRDECRPKFLNLQLKKLPSASDRDYYDLKVTIPKNSQTGSWSGSIVLLLKGPRPQRMVIPIRGSGKY